MKTATCFFCYAWNEDNTRYNRLDFLREKIEEKSCDRVEVILDKHNYEDNADFNELRERIKSYDLVVVFFTPDFKEIIDDNLSNKNKNREVLKEYNIIVERYKEDKNSVFPVILEGTKESSLPDLFGNKNARLFESFKIFKNEKKKYIVPNAQKKEFKLFIGKIINTSIHNGEDRSEEYKTSVEALDKLFGLTDNVAIPHSCLVKPDIYNQIRTQKCMFVTGRKGSGKSTFINNFREMDRQYYDENFKKMMPISAESFNYENAYDFLFKKHMKDQNLIEPHTVLCLFWKVYFVLYILIVIRGEIEDHTLNENDKRFKIFDKITKRLMKRMNLKTGKKSYDTVNDPDIMRLIFMAAVQMVDDRFTSALDEIGNSDILYASYAAKINLSSIIEKEFLPKNTKEFIDALKKCKRSILISLDGFDTHSEDFRMATNKMDPCTEEYRSRKEFEELFFRTLLEVATQFRDKKVNGRIGSVLGKITKYCIVLPKDRYDQIIDTDRDCFKKTFGTLSWSAQELQELLTRRLEYLILRIDSSYIVSDEKSYDYRMDEALSFFEGLPSSIEMNVNGNVMQMSLFNYILRSSFWRPRDVISNLNKIMAQVIRISGENWNSKGDSINEEDIKLSIKKNADKIIEREFIGEYKNVFRNIDEVLEQLQRLDEQMDIREFNQVLKGISFDTAFSYDMSQVDNKMRVLYQLGVIGLIYKKSIAKRLHYLTHICFEFNEGMTPFEDYLKQKKNVNDEIQVVFNPLFAGRLMLNYNTKELIGNWDKEYIHENDVNKESIYGM